MSQQFAPDWFSPPGSTVAMLMARQNVSSGELARRMNADSAFVLRIISGTEPIEEAVAERLATALGGTPSFWTARQSKFEAALDRTASKLSPESARTWLRTLPLKDMNDAGWIACRSKSNLLQAALAYFSVTTPDEWRDRYAAHATTFSYRTSEAFESKLGALAAWLRQGELRASGITCKTWSPAKFREALHSIRGLTRLKEPTKFIGRLRSLCAAAGVAVVFLKAPTGCRASGATRFITPDKAMIKLGRRLDEVFLQRFGSPPPEALNTSHRMVIVASEFDSSSRRIVEYLAEHHGLDINATFFRMFEHVGEQLLATEWLMDPEQVVERSEAKVRAPWSGLWYANIGDGPSRSWEDMRKYGFVAAGGGRHYSGRLAQLEPGAIIYAYQKQQGYAGVGRVTAPACMARDAVVDGKHLLSLPLQQANLAHDKDDPESAEYVVLIDWGRTVPLAQAKTFTGAFANQNVVCKLRDPTTIEFLQREFGAP